MKVLANLKSSSIGALAIYGTILVGLICLWALMLASVLSYIFRTFDINGM